MFVEMIHKLVAAKTITPFLLLTTLFTKEHKIKEDQGHINYDEALGDNFPHVFCKGA